MALPQKPNSQIFESDQTPVYDALYWDTTSTSVMLGDAFSPEEQYVAAGTGVEFASFTLFDPSVAPQSRSDWETILSPYSGKTSATLGYESDTYRTGVVPSIYQYWGAGALPGISRAKSTILKYSGSVRKACKGHFVFAGQGTVAAFLTRGSTTTLIASGQVREPETRPDLTNATASVIQQSWGYLLNEEATELEAGDTIELYYMHNGEPWGGISAKFIPEELTFPDEDFRARLQDTAFVGASFMSASGEIGATTLPYLESAEVRKEGGSISQAELIVALAPASEPTGYRLDGTGQTTLLDNGSSTLAIQAGRLVHLRAGYVRPDGSYEMYPRFTGFIDTIEPTSDGKSAAIKCRAIESKLTEPFDENLPDRLSYHANGFILREHNAEPVYGIPAYDNWPIETAVVDLCARAGVDAQSLGLPTFSPTPQYGRREFRALSTGETHFGQRFFSARRMASKDKKIRLERNANYGNVPPLYKDYLPTDDQYLFTPDVTKRIYDRVKELCDQYGYDFTSNTQGMVCLEARNNPTYFQYLTQPGPYLDVTAGQFEDVAVSAVGGRILKRTHEEPSWSRTIEGNFARADLYAGIGRSGLLNGGRITATLDRWDGTNWEFVATKTITTWQQTDESYYYDDATRDDGTNAAVFTLFQVPFDRYRVTIDPAGIDPRDTDATNCLYRLNGVAIYERDPNSSAFMNHAGPIQLSTLQNALSVKPKSAMEDLRNHVVVVGARKATITDSAKLDDTEHSNPNNPEQEFNVAIAADPYSIYDPTSPNFVGGKRMTVVFNDKVSDTDFARWLAKTILFRYRVPSPSVPVEHTAIPHLELRDGVHIYEAKYNSVQQLGWVSSFTERWASREATVEIEAVPYAEFPSYQPREDIDIDSLFVDPRDGKGEPAIGIDITYKNIYGEVVAAEDLSNAGAIKGFATRTHASSPPMASKRITSGTSMGLDHAAIPETIYLGWNISHTSRSAPNVLSTSKLTVQKKRALVNNPYRHFFHIPSWLDKKPTLSFTFDEGDDSGVYNKSWYNFPGSGATGDSWYAIYDYLTSRGSQRNPYYDPYTSELGNLVTVSFTPLVSGRYRVSVRDASGQFQEPIAWLSNPSSDPKNAEAHWQYMEAGSRQTMLWDGSDNIGEWNTQQSLQYANEIRGAFGEEKTNVGHGFYAWNDQTTNSFTAIGDTNNRNFGPDGSPYYTIGKYGQFEIRIEVVNDELLQKDIAEGSPHPRVVNSSSLPTTIDGREINTTSETYVWSHLPNDPTQVAIRIQEWAGTRPWTPNLTTSEHDWTDYSSPNPEASISEGEPVRITFAPRRRRGYMWEGGGSSGVLLTRQVHLKATVFDSFWRFGGKTWQEFDPKYSVGAAEEKRVVNRMFHNEDHTLSFTDTAYRDAKNLSTYEWIFEPRMFEKDFGRGFPEPLRYGDYEQLEALPGFDNKSLGGTASRERSSLLLAYLNYLFYFSAYSLDRSGRRQWCLNSWTDDAGKRRGWIDKTKSATIERTSASSDPSSPNYRDWAIADYERNGADKHLIRSIFVRQWKEEGWRDGSYRGSPVQKYNITDPVQLRYVQAPYSRFDPYSTGSPNNPLWPYFAGPTALEDTWLKEMATEGSMSNRISRMTLGDQYRVSKSIEPGQSFRVVPPSFGTWSLERPTVEGFYLPNPGRDFHPYWRYPVMPDWATMHVWNHAGEAPGVPYSVSGLAGTASAVWFQLRDLARTEIWYAYGFSEAHAQNYYDNSTGEIAFRRKFFGPRRETTVWELGASRPLPKHIWHSKEGVHSEFIAARATTLDEPTIAALFDYSRQDELDRYDQYRGVISRAPCADPNAHASTTMHEKEKRRATSAQPVKPAGVYLINLARYHDYVLGGVHKKEPSVLVHFTQSVSNWFALRFDHEYIWYSPQYFPCTREGAATYMYTRDEHTGVSGWVGFPWREQSNSFDPTKTLFYDAGAWTGFKGDQTPTQWGMVPRLKWKELSTATVEAPNGTVTATGGYEPEIVSTSGPVSAALPDFYAASLGNVPHKRINMFDEYYSRSKGPRLAVGRESGAQREIIMNLSLSDNLVN